MIVYLAFTADYGDREYIGVFNSREKAKTALEKDEQWQRARNQEKFLDRNRELRAASYDIEEHEVK